MRLFRGIALVILLVAVTFAVPVVPERAAAQELDDAVAQVVGGRDAGDHEFPHLVAVFFDGFQACGGVLIAADWVVSAAHCFVDVPIDSILLGLGSADLQNNLRLFTVERVVIHPDFEPDPFVAATNDIALVQLSSPADLTDPTLGLAAMPGDGQPTGPLLVAGWGDVDPSTNFEPAVIARVAQVQAIPCRSLGDDALRLCTSDADGDGGCTGDSGGPLIEVKGGAHTLVAVVEATANPAGGSPLCGSNTAVIHQRVAPHLAWMQSVTGELFHTCNGRAVISEVTPGVPFLGTDADDVILGTAGDDVINGRGGDDMICALDGRDRIRGGPGDDTIYGGFGIDTIYGDNGNDTLDGDGGSDRMFGGAGNDLMLGDSGADRMYGGDGDDEIRGMGGQDFMWGEAGNDLMQGNFQTDNMWGGPGNDTMFGSGGKDSLFGEAGNDSLSGGNNTDYLDGGADIDIANGGRGRDKPLAEPKVRASNGQLFDGSGCIAETIVNCQPTP